MGLIARFELAGKNKYELGALLRGSFKELARSKVDTP